MIFIEKSTLQRVIEIFWKSVSVVLWISQEGWGYLNFDFFPVHNCSSHSHPRPPFASHTRMKLNFQLKMNFNFAVVCWHFIGWEGRGVKEGGRREERVRKEIAKNLHLSPLTLLRLGNRPPPFPNPLRGHGGSISFVIYAKKEEIATNG